MTTLRVETTLGAIEGVARKEHAAFLGIPFAAAPVGSLRFRAPEPALPWTSVREAKAFSPAAMQGVEFAPGVGIRGAQREDCLYLNVFTPALHGDAEGKPRPVLFWVHGGAFTVGTAGITLYDGGALAELGDVVVVTANYRVGALGFLVLGEHGTELGARANLGLLDQVAALRWVQENITRFGGDPANVTLFGESAGGTAVSLLMAAAEARPLFRRAIVQSGTGPLRVAKEARALEVTERLLERLGLSLKDAPRLQTMPAKELMAAQHALESDGSLWPHFFPVLDGALFTEQPGESIAKGALKDIPLLTGTNRDEWNLFAAMDMKSWAAPLDEAAQIALLQRAMPRASDVALRRLAAGYANSRQVLGLLAHPRAVLRAIEGDLRFRIPATRFAEAHLRAGADVYSYLFAYGSPGLRGELGACHALEIPFVFGSLSAPNQARFVGEGPAVEALSRGMMQAWAAFARSGDPSCEALGAWPRFDERTRSTMVLNAESAVEKAPFEAERSLWDELGL